MAEYWAPAVNALVVAAIVSFIGAVVRWGFKLDSNVRETSRAVGIVSTQLVDHISQDDERHRATEAALVRLNNIALASNGHRPYARKRRK